MFGQLGDVVFVESTIVIKVCRDDFIDLYGQLMLIVKGTVGTPGAT